MLAVLLLLTSLEAAPSRRPIVNWCNETLRELYPQSMDSQIIWRKYALDLLEIYKMACYFEVMNATEMANEDLGGGNYNFSPQAAREICREFDATLPTFQPTTGHNDVLFFTNGSLASFDGSDRYPFDQKIDLIALGATLTESGGKVQAEWDDGFVETDLKFWWGVEKLKDADHFAAFSRAAGSRLTGDLDLKGKRFEDLKLAVNVEISYKVIVFPLGVPSKKIHVFCKQDFYKNAYIQYLERKVMLSENRNEQTRCRFNAAVAAFLCAIVFIKGH